MPNPISSTTDHLFREKYGEILAALLRSSGYEHFELAEEAVQVAFQRSKSTICVNQKKAM